MCYDTCKKVQWFQGFQNVLKQASDSAKVGDCKKVHYEPKVNCFDQSDRRRVIEQLVEFMMLLACFESSVVH